MMTFTLTIGKTKTGKRWHLVNAAFCNMSCLQSYEHA